MNKSKAAEWAVIYKAYADGKALQINHGTTANPNWVDTTPRTELLFVLGTEEYRLRPTQGVLDLEKRINKVINMPDFISTLQYYGYTIPYFKTSWMSQVKEGFYDLPLGARRAIEAGEAQQLMIARQAQIESWRKQLPAGYRWLNAGEIIRKGDKYISGGYAYAYSTSDLGGYAYADANGCVWSIRPLAVKNPNLFAYRYLGSTEYVAASDVMWVDGPINNWVTAINYAGRTAGSVPVQRIARRTMENLVLPEGYRVLGLGECYQAGDEAWGPQTQCWNRLPANYFGNPCTTQDVIRPLKTEVKPARAANPCGEVKCAGYRLEVWGD